jgi:GTP-binding protein
MTTHYQKAYFLLSVATIKQLPADQGMEVAIVGRSNAGKSSVLNRITQNKGLARISKTPGRTQQVNLFSIDASRRLADLPGYGYAKAPLNIKQQWQTTVDQYMRTRQSLKGLVLVMDSRHPLKPLDQQLLTYSAARALPVHVLLNKADQLSRQDRIKTLHLVTTRLSQYDEPVSVQLFSALDQMGINALYEKLDQWYGYAR